MESIKYDDWINEAAKAGHITVIIGRKGSGKSAQGYAIAEDINKVAKKEVYVLGLPQTAKKLLPKSFTIVDDILQVPNGSCVFTDEAAIHFSSKEWYKKGHSELAKLIEIARHKELSLVFVTLNTASVDVNVLRFVDSVLFKPLSLLQLELERQQMKKIIAEAQAAFADHVPEGEDERSYTYVIGDKKRGMMKTTLPTFWTDDLSTSYEAFALRDEDEEWEVPVLMGEGPGQGAEWACMDCISWEEPKDEDGWCSLGFFDAPRKKCDSRRRISKKPKRILGKRDVKVKDKPKKFKKNPQPAPLVNITQITIAHNEIPVSNPKPANKCIVKIAGAKANPPQDPPGDEDYLNHLQVLCNAYLKNPKNLVENLSVLKDEVAHNHPIDYAPEYDRFGESLDNLIAFQKRSPKIFCAIQNPPPFQKGEYIQLRGKDTYYLATQYQTAVVHYELSKEETWPSAPHKLKPADIVQLSGIFTEKDGRTYFSFRSSASTRGCWFEWGPISIEWLDHFEKVPEPISILAKIGWWNKAIGAIKTKKEWEVFIKSLEDAREKLNLNFVFIYSDAKTKKGVRIFDPEDDDTHLLISFRLSEMFGNKLQHHHIKFNEIPLKLNLQDKGCEQE